MTVTSRCSDGWQEDFPSFCSSEPGVFPSHGFPILSCLILHTPTSHQHMGSGENTQGGLWASRKEQNLPPPRLPSHWLELSHTAIPACEWAVQCSRVVILGREGRWILWFASISASPVPPGASAQCLHGCIPLFVLLSPVYGILEYFLEEICWICLWNMCHFYGWEGVYWFTFQG